MENKMYTKPQYKCCICGKIYDSITERAQCELACVKKQEEEVKKAAELKKREEYNTRRAEVDKAFDHAYELRDKFLKDYDSYTYHKAFTDVDRVIHKNFGWLL